MKASALFHCRWDESEAVPSLIVGAADEASARTMAAEVAEGAPPCAVVPVPPGVFVCEVITRRELRDPEDETDEEKDDDQIVCAPVPHTEEALDLLDAGAITSFAEGAGQCADVADVAAEGDEESLVRCERAAGHDGDHEAEGGAFTWS